MAKEKIKPGDTCLLDARCDLGLREYQVSQVVIVKKIFPNRFLCAPMKPVVFPVSDSNYALRYFVIHKCYLTKISPDERVVIRTPINMPTFTSRDKRVIHEAIESLIDKGYTDSNILIKSLKKIEVKISYVEEFNDVNGV